MSGGRAVLSAAFGAVACTAPNPDYVMQGECEAGSRQCVVSQQRGAYPVVCGRDGMGQLVLLDERCPSAAACRAGLCAAPDGARPCNRQRDCEKGTVCVPLVGEERSLTRVCLPARSAAAAPGQRCERDEDCQSYLCLPFRTGNYCLRACRAAQDCEIPDECRTLDITVTGVAGTIQSCLPAQR